MTSAYLTLNMSESNDFSISQRIEREVPSSFSELDKRKQKRKEVAIFGKSQRAGIETNHKKCK
jgi:hypothetical protein